MSGRLLRVVIQELASTVVWLSILSALHKLTLPRTSAVLLALGFGVIAGTVLALVGRWIQRPMTIAPMWELAARLGLWIVLVTVSVLVALEVGPAAGGCLFAAVVAADGPPTVRQVRTVSRQARRRRQASRRAHAAPACCSYCGQ